MKSYPGVLAVLVCVGLVTSCGGERENVPDVENVRFSHIMCPKAAYNALSGEAANKIINSQEEFDAAWAAVNYDGSSELPPVDFSKGSLIMIYGGSRGTSNEWVDVTDIETAPDGQLRVKYNNFTSNHAGCGGDTVISYPFCIVQADAHAVSAEFHHVELNACDAAEKPDLE